MKTNPQRMPWRKSIRWKLMIMYISLVFIVMLISGTFMIVRLRINEDNKARIELSQQANLIVGEVSSLLSEGGATAEALEEIFKNSFIASSRFQINLINLKTGATQNTNVPGERGNPRYTSSVIVSATEGKDGYNSGRTYPDVNGTIKTWMEYACPVFDGSNNIVYVVYVRMDAQPMLKSMSNTTETIALALVIALAFTAIMGILFSSTITVPIVALTKGARDLASGRQDTEIPVLSYDEIGQLTKSFNVMADELKSTIANMQNEKNKLEVVLHNMSDGVMAVDSAGKVIHYNHICKELLDTDGDLGDIAGLPVTRIKELLDIKEDMDISKAEPRTVKLGGKFISVTFSSYSAVGRSPGGVVIVLQDITKRMHLENMRKEFVANVSHEIRTPLTTVKSYTETLMDGAVDDRGTAMDFLSIINSEADRMSLLVTDLLELSRMDSSQMEFNMKRTDLRDLVRKNISHHEMVAKKKNKTISFEEYNEPMLVECDPERINQVLNNIISNSLKYSAGGAFVKVWMETTSMHHKVYVKDNGMGIPREDLRRIFERFYRVDKARSRELGGTGLGLSIAQEIMEAHGGKISVVSEQGVGTTMIVRFPKPIEKAWNEDDGL